MLSNIPTKPEDAIWTDDQWKAIWATGQDTLVAAAAGSGKTAVLVERIIQKIIAKTNPINVDELLIVTFTNASAAEMRHRIGQAIEKAIEQDPTSTHLRTQLSLLNKASISTLHSFCLEVVRKYYYLIDLDPGFRIADKTEGDLLRDEVLDDLFEEEYGKEDNDLFYRLVDSFTSDRSDMALQEMIRKLHEFSTSHPNPNKWLNSLIEMYDIKDHQTIEELPFMEALLLDIRLKLEGAKAQFQHALHLTKVPGGPAPRAENFIDDLAQVDMLLQASDHSWEALYNAFQKVAYTKLTTCRGKDYEKELVDQSKKFRDKGKDMIEKLGKELFSRKPESFLHDIRNMKDLISSLVSLVIVFGERFKQMKTEKGLVDFSDLEHYCLEILAQSDQELLPSPAAMQYRERFKEVLVDEYQDTNMVQESLLKLVTQDYEENGNMFMVGDVKQSIYRFRLAEPNLFLSKYNRFQSNPDGTGMRIDLSQNFRSRNEVLEGTNYLFKQIMGVQVGEIEYSREAELVKGAPYQEDKEFPIEVTLIDQEGSAPVVEGSEEEQSDQFSKEDLESSVLEARYMAAKVKELIEERTPVYDAKTKTERPLEYKDIVILLRSMPWAATIMDEFKKQGIPIYANLSTGYFDATEVAIMLSLLKIIDNPYQDIPLVSVLRSPIVNLDEEALASIRIHSKSGNFYEALQNFLEKKPGNAFQEEVFEKASRFMSLMQNWRTRARQGAVSDLIWELYRDTGYYDFVGGITGGKQRQANLRALYDRARQYESTSFRGLFRFIRFIDRMRDRGDDLGAARALSEQEDVVRLMTIHSSKGLEFPIVFVAGLSKKFNLMDLNQAYLLDKDLGFATKYTDPDKRISYPSLPQLAFKRKKRLESISEEMRVLYVALTRAKEKLYLVGTVKEIEKSIQKWEQTTQHTDWLLENYVRAEATCYLDWIGPSLMRHSHCHPLRGEAMSIHSSVPEEITNHPSCWKINLLHKSEFEQQEEETEADHEDWKANVMEGKPVGAVSEVHEEVIERLNWKYEYQSATKQRSKQSVSELKRMFEIRDEATSTELIHRMQKPIFKRPKFMQSKELSPAEKGTAMHTVMQHVSLEHTPTATDIEQLCEELVRKEILSEEQKQAIDVESITSFFTSPLGQRVLHASFVQREIPFSLSVPASQLDPEAADDEENTILVQGVIDCMFRDAQGLVLLDYKTDGIYDRYKGGFEEAKPILEKRYQVQIELYSNAVEEIWKEPITEKHLYFFDGSHTISFA